MYSDAFCRAYNALGWNYFPEAVGEQLLQWMAEQRLSLRSALDLGCGTGVLCEKLREGGMEVMGMDLSENMIAIARARQPESRGRPPLILPLTSLGRTAPCMSLECRRVNF